MAPKRRTENSREGHREQPKRNSFWRLLLVMVVGFFAYCCSGGPLSKRTERNAPKGPTRGSGFETKDASVGWIFAIVGMLAVSGIAIHLLLGGYLGHLKNRPAPEDAWQPLARPAGGLVAPVGTFPRLQVAPPFDLAGFRAREEEHLNSYGWVNRTSGVVHIPISRAMDLLLKKGVPVGQADNSGPSSYEMQIDRVQQQAPKKEEQR